MKVDFMIIGAMKCGTSSLAALLARHPDIGLSRPKETNFFIANHNWRDKLPEYELFFAHKNARLHCEGSTTYTQMPWTDLNICDRLYEYNRELKFIYMVRHPVNRAISQYMHLYKRGYADQDFNTSLFSTNILSIGRYFFQIDPYIRKFGRDKILIIKFEDFIADQRATLRQVCQFLGVEFTYPENMKPAHNNPTLGKDVLSIKHEKIFKMLIAPLKFILSEKNITAIREKMKKLNRKRSFSVKIVVSKEDEMMILHYTAHDIEKLQEIVSFDLSGYLVPYQE